MLINPYEHNFCYYCRDRTAPAEIIVIDENMKGEVVYRKSCHWHANQLHQLGCMVGHIVGGGSIKVD